MIYLLIIFIGLETDNCLNPEIGNKGLICSWEKEDFRIYINEKEGIYDTTQMKRHNTEDNRFEEIARKRYWEKKNEEWRAERNARNDE
tara:strand:- start:142 stop:405 length:264 start_codon:yes stop_codon:yes gene_type:complete